MSRRGSTEEVAHEFFFFRVYKDGRIKMHSINEKVAPYDDPFTGVCSKDMTICYQPKISARIFMPSNPTHKLPIIFYVHGNGFCLQIAFAQRYQTFLTPLAAEAHAIVFTFTYGGFPKRPLSACYEDCWAALKWVISHSTGDGPEPWLNNHADFRRFFICGNSSGGTITHFLASRLGMVGLPASVKLVGLGIIQPVFAGYSKLHDDLWMYLSNGCIASEDPRQNPTEKDLSMINCERVWVAVGGDDEFKEGGIRYYKALRILGWMEGTVELEIFQGQPHSLFLLQPNHDSTLDLIKKFAAFINKENVDGGCSVGKITAESKL